MPSIQCRAVLLTVGLAVGVLTYLLGAPPTALPDRLAVIPASAVHIDNELYDADGFGWADDDMPLRLINGARIPYFIQRARAKLGDGELALLDVGCGGGIASNEMAAAGFNVTGVDISPNSVKAAQKAAASRGLSAQYVVSSAYSLPFPDGSFDVVLSSDVLEHLHDVRRALREVARVLRPGGVFLYDTVNRTAFSWVMLIRVLQDWLRVIPADVHDWRLFITPDELRTAVQDAGLQPCPAEEMRGMRPTLRRDLAEIKRRWRKSGAGALLDSWVQDGFMGGSFLGYATKH